MIERLGRRFAHYFRREDSTQWYFFHNSFRLFLLERTAEFPPGTADTHKDRGYHIALGDICSKQPEGSAWAWEELFHRASGEQHSRVLELATQGYFRSQFFALRSSSAIRTDILIALRSAAFRADPVALARLCLIGSEMTQRNYYLEQVPYMLMMAKLGYEQAALDHICAGNQLLVDSGTALKAAVILNDLGFESEARRIFEIAEPFDLFPGNRALVDLTEDWVRAALSFQQVGRVIGTIRQLSYQDDDPDTGDDGSPAYSLQSRMLSVAGLELLASGRWSCLSEIFNAFDITRRSDALTRFWLHFSVYRNREAAGDKARATEHLESMLSIDDQALGPEERTVLAEGVYRLLGNDGEARNLIRSVGQPQLQTGLYSAEGGLTPFYQRFRLNRLLYVLGDRRSPSEIIPDPDDLRNNSMVLFERALCTAAHIWARAWVGHPMDGKAVKSEATPLLRLFSSSNLETHGGINRFAVSARGSDFCSLLTEAVAQHGINALEGLWHGFEEEWDNPVTFRHWPTEKRRKVILAFVRVGMPSPKVVEKLREIDEVVGNEGDVYERVRECVDHAQAWLDVGDRENARRYFHRAFEVCFGVGFRKDYQLDTWISWLGRINAVEPERTAERIWEYAQAIEELEEISETPAVHSAAAELLEVTFRWSPLEATQLFVWFVERGLISYETGMHTLLREGVNCSAPPLDALLEAFSACLLPFSIRPQPELMSSVIKRVRDFRSETRVLQDAQDLVSKVRLYANPAVRPIWLQGMAQGFKEIGLSMQDVGVEDSELIHLVQEESTHQAHLQPKDGSTAISSQEVANRISSVSDLLYFLELEEENSFFHWAPVVSKVARETSDEDGLLLVADTFKTRRLSSDVLVSISDRLYELGNKQRAWEIAEEALAASSDYGWTRFGGRSRFLALRTLSRMDSDKTAPLVFEHLVRDLIANDTGLIQSITLDLDDILELLIPDVPVPEIWSEIEEHTKFLLPSGRLPSQPMVFSATAPTDTCEMAFVNLMALFLDHHCPALAQAVQRGLGRLVLDNKMEVSRLLDHPLYESEGYQERALMLIDAISSTSPQLVFDAREHIEKLLRSPNWSIRLMAISIHRNCGWEIPVTSAMFNPLPGIYRLVLVSQDPADPIDDLTVQPGEVIPDSDNPVRVVAPFNRDIKVVSRVADVPEENFRRRVVGIMHTLAPRETWSALADRRLQSTLNSAGLLLPNLRPRARLARRAIFHAIAELEDAGRISGEGAEFLGHILSTYDPKMILLEPNNKPVQIPEVSGPTSGVHVEEWASGVEESLIHTNWLPANQRVVLAEATIIVKRGSWESPTESRYSQLEPRSSATLDDVQTPEGIFGTTINGRLSEYVGLVGNSDSPVLVLRNTAYGYYSPGSNWIAVNPAIAHQLDWSLAGDGLFKWVNSQGETMVETIWWTDGPVDLFAVGSGDGAVGEGWVVLASQAALEAIQREFGPLCRNSLVVRSCTKGREFIDRSAVCLNPI